MELQPRSCPLCNCDSELLYSERNFKAEDFNEFTFASRKKPEPFHLQLFLCKSCDLLYANPMLAEEMVKNEYEKASFDSSIEAAYAARTYANYLPINTINSALDIGTGGGEFLLEIRKKGVTDVQGIEPSFSAIATASSEIKNVIKQGFFAAGLYKDKQFDLISCFQTLEHVANPLQLSRDVFSLLKPNGIFYAVAHNFRGNVNRVLGMRSPIYDIEHLQLFSPQSLQNMMQLAGFQDIKVFPIINNYPLFYWVKLLPGLPMQSQIINLIKKIKIGYLPIPIPIGNLGVMGIRK